MTVRILLLLGAALPSLALAQTPPPVIEGTAAPAPDADFDDVDEIVVTGARQRGAVIGDIQPEQQLSPRDIRTFGASNIGELLQELGTLTRSGRGSGPPVVLVNGKRVSGFQEIRNLPPEAIERVDILPEEVALTYGFRADQRVVNFVLRQRFRALTGEVELGGATAGGRPAVELEANLARIRGDSRLSLEGEYAFEGLLSEAERGVTRGGGAPFAIAGNVAAPGGGEIDPALSALAGTLVTVSAVPAEAGAPTLADFVGGANRPAVDGPSGARSLLPRVERIELGGTLSRPLGGAQASINGRLTRTLTGSLLGLPDALLRLPAGNPFSPFGNDVLLYRSLEAPGALGRSADAVSTRLGGALTGQRAAWRWSLTGAWDHANTVTRTDVAGDQTVAQARLDSGDPAFNPYIDPLNTPLSQTRARSTTDTVQSEAVASGPVLDLPAGPLATTLKAGGELRRLESEDAIGGETRLARDQGSLQASIDLPLASRRREALAALGNLSVNLNLAATFLSDFGALSAIGYGLNWEPVEALRLIASVTHEDGAPGIGQLGDPLIATPNVRLFDFRAGETVEVTRLDGGNPDLSAESRRIVRLGVNLRPIKDTDLTLSANFVDSRIRNAVSAFPTLTPEIEAAFPDRFIRDGAGRLLVVDNRPINFERSDRREIRWGLTWSEALEPTKAEQARIAARIAEARARRAAATAAQPQPPSGSAAAQPPPGDGAPSGAAGRGPGGPPGGGFGGPRGIRPGEGRLTLGLFHTWRLEETISIRDGVPVLDLLDGSATGGRGGQPRHSLELRASIAKNGFGARLQADWQSATRVLADRDNPSPSDLFFDDFSTLNLRLFADLGQVRGAGFRNPLLRGARISIDVDNVFDRRIRVTDRAGATPIGYQPDLLDPLGRTITFRFRKLLF